MKIDNLWRTLVGDVRRGIPKEQLAALFHDGIAGGFICAAMRARESTGISQVVMAGGCMHNRRLAQSLRSGLEHAGFQVFQHRQVSPGDGGLSYGQAVVAAAMLNKESPR